MKGSGIRSPLSGGAEHYPGEAGLDSALVTKAQHGDRVAFGELAAAIGGRLYALAYRIIRDVDAAQDATQEAIVHAWRDLPALRDPERFETWAFRILVRECYREARRRRSRGPQLYAVPDPSIEDHVATVANRDELERVLLELTPDQRAVVAMHYYLRMSHPEIAETLSIPVGTVGSRIHAAKRALRAALDAEARAARIGGRSA